jgi:predicted RNase H-like HicB family nuclease
VEYRVRIHQEDGSYWADVEGLPGCFASGRTLDELKEAVVEAITMYLSDDEAAPAASGQVDEMRVLVGT